MISIPQTWLVITTLLYYMINGAQIFETCVIIPKWTASPPESFQLLKGKYGIDLKTFWIWGHSIHEITFILAIVFCWKTPLVKGWLIALFLAHFAVRVWTLLYFAPNIIAFQKMANGQGEISRLFIRTRLWRNMNYLRVGIFIAISIGQTILCIYSCYMAPLVRQTR
ncbi:MAG: transposase [Chitinophagaceae bacterium]|nr:transposase [Chitinophagaceae bacterium]